MAIAQYFADLRSETASRWNRFWFTPRDPLTLCVLRILVGLVAMWYVGSFSVDLVRLFGPSGLASPEAVELFMGWQNEWSARFSPLFHIQGETGLWLFHGAALLAVAAFTAGLFTRITAVLALGAVLSYINRAPFLIGPLEPVLSCLLLYLCLSPCGEYLSLDRLLPFRKKLPPSGRSEAAPLRYVLANIATRLMQVHISALILMMGLSKLMGESWWNGDAAWWLMAHTETRLVDLTFLHSAVVLVAAWTHAIVAFELCFPLLVWKARLRPLLLVLSVVMWALLALVTAQVGFSAMMIVAGLAFLSPDEMRALLRPFRGAPGMSAALAAR
jgi:hypothetical protein